MVGHYESSYSAQATKSLEPKSVQLVSLNRVSYLPPTEGRALGRRRAVKIQGSSHEEVPPQRRSPGQGQQGTPTTLIPLASIPSVLGITSSIAQSKQDLSRSDMDDPRAPIEDIWPPVAAESSTWIDSSNSFATHVFNPVANNPAPLSDRVARTLRWVDPESAVHDYWASTISARSRPCKERSILYHGNPNRELDQSIPCESGLVQHLPADHLLSLIYYNVFRAFVRIIHTLNLNIVRMCHGDYQSTFTVDTDRSQLKHIPAMLHPTILQRTIPHHPMLDIFPSAQLRDNMLTQGQYHTHDGKLCDDLVGNGNFECDFEREGNTDPVVRQGLIVWGEPFDVANWEVGDAFVKKWGWFLKGTTDIEESTNAWRRKRGESRLSFA
jgi:Domain of unknown function (DUF3425)